MRVTLGLLLPAVLQPFVSPHAANLKLKKGPAEPPKSAAPAPSKQASKPKSRAASSRKPKQGECRESECSSHPFLSFAHPWFKPLSLSV